MLKLTQKHTEIEGKVIAYVETTLNIDGYTYTVRFDERTKKRFNTYARKNGFVIGAVDTPPPSLAKEVY